MLAVLQLVGVIVAHPTFDSTFPAVTSFAVDNGNGIQFGSVPGTVYNCSLRRNLRIPFTGIIPEPLPKQLDKETDAKPIAYGGMLIGVRTCSTDLSVCNRICLVLNMFRMQLTTDDALCWCNRYLRWWYRSYDR